MARNFRYEVLSDGYKIWINDVLTIIQRPPYAMPYPDTTHEVDTPEYYAGCAENDIAQMQAEDAKIENEITEIVKIKSRVNLSADRIDALEEAIFSMMI